MQRQFSMFAGVFARAVSMLVGLALWLACAGSARAYEEQASLDLALGYAGIVPKTCSASFPYCQTLHPHLGSVDVGASFGIRDFLVLRAALGYGFLLERKEKTQQAGRGRVEVAYLVDILKWVPFFGLGVGVWGVRRYGEFTFYPTGHVVAGLDYLATRSWTLGVDIRIGMLLESQKLRSWNEGQLRVGYMFELF